VPNGHGAINPQAHCSDCTKLLRPRHGARDRTRKLGLYRKLHGRFMLVMMVGCPVTRPILVSASPSDQAAVAAKICLRSGHLLRKAA
jgi:hypothetical protein